MKFKKKDLILVVGVVVIALLAGAAHFLLQGSGKEQVVVKIDGVVDATYDLNEEQEIIINNGSNVLMIKDGKADMIEADCPDKLCVDQRVISKNNESIICLPNKVVVEVLSPEESELDGMTN